MDNRKALVRVEELIVLANNATATMDFAVVARLRASAENFLLDQFGTLSVLYKAFKQVGHWSSLANLKEISGVLQAARDLLREGMESDRKQLPDRLTFMILRHFYSNTYYNWESIRNLVLSDPLYFEYELNQAKEIFDKLIERGMIAYSGYGEAYNITPEGKRLYELLAPAERPAVKNAVAFRWDAFLCHSSRDKAVIAPIIGDFKNKGISYWFDEEQIGPGDIIVDKITQGLEYSRNIIACISTDQLQSGWCRNEYQAILSKVIANTTTQKVVGFILDNTRHDELPLLLTNYHYLRYHEPAQYDKLLAFLKSPAD